MEKISEISRSFRLVCEPGQVASVERLLEAEGFAFRPEPFSPYARRLVASPFPLGASLAAFFGCIYIQDRSSMLPPLALGSCAGELVLDMCASPGSKTGFLATLAGKDGFILANEPNRTRLGTLLANVERSAALNVGICSHPGERLPLPDGLFDKILLDPPCSGWGTVEKNPRVTKIWTPEKARTLISLQRRLLARAARLLTSGGMLLYSTCTTNYEENEAQIGYAEQELGLRRIPLAPFPGFSFEERPGGDGTLLVAGGESKSQGFYLALLKAPGEATKKSPVENGMSKSGSSLPPVPDLARLPEGSLENDGLKIRFHHAQAGRLPKEFHWRAPVIGSDKGGGFRPEPRMRSLLAQPAPGASVVFEDARELRNLVSGQSLQTGLKVPCASLWWQDLPLGFSAVKNGRLAPNFR